MPAQDLVEPDLDVTPFASPYDCLVLQHNSGVISKKIMTLYAAIDKKLVNEPSDKKIQGTLDAIKKLSDINLSITKTYEVFCKS